MEFGYHSSDRTKRRKIKASVDEHIRSIQFEIDEGFRADIEATEQFGDFVVDIPSISTTNIHNSCNISDQCKTGISIEENDNAEDSCISPTPFLSESDEFGNEQTFSSTDSDTDAMDNDSKESIKNRLAEWAILFNIPHFALSSLLCILRDADLNVPKDPRTLLGTPRHTDVKEIAGGSYHYFGIASSICDKFHGEIPVELNAVDTLSLNINVDGLPLFRSSNSQLWPILGIVNEARNKAPFIIAVYGGSCKPKSIDEYLFDFVEETKSLIQNGLDCFGKHYSFRLNAFICDAPARAYLKCIKGHAGYNSCERCTQEGVYTEGRMTFPKVDTELRTDVQFRTQSSEDHHTGVSPLLELGIDCVSMFVLDYMHLVCLGVVRRLILLWLKGPLTCRLQTASIQSISEQLLLARRYLPREFCRKPRSLLDIMQWKATEFRQFLLYTGPIVLLGSLSDSMYRNFMTLSVSMHILLSPGLCNLYCDYAERLLKVFVQNFAALYGSNVLVYNVHSLLHLAQDARKFGALDNISAFPFESLLGRLKKKVRRAKDPVAQIVCRIRELQTTGLVVSSACPLPLLKKQHSRGPVPSGALPCLQYQRYINQNVTISCTEGDNCFEIQGHIAFVRNIVSLASGKVQIVYEHFNSCESFFKYPLDSSSLSVHCVSALSGQLKLCDVEDVGQKFISLPFKHKSVVMPLLHLQ